MLKESPLEQEIGGYDLQINLLHEAGLLEETYPLLKDFSNYDKIPKK